MTAVSGARPVPLWIDSLEGNANPRPALSGSTFVDVAIVGGGFSGLWTAYYLLEKNPSLNILIIEKEYCGYGASGRNGGWCEGALAGGTEKYAKRSSLEDALRLERAMFETVDEVKRIIDLENIDCGFTKGGHICLARNKPQEERQLAELRAARSRGFGENIIRRLEPDEARQYLNATHIKSGLFFSPCASINPAKLVCGLAEAVESRGGRIVEGTTVLSIDGTAVMTSHGEVNADVVIQATEAYTRDLKGKKLDFLPVYSRMIATEPLSDDLMAEIGLADRPTFNDGRYIVIYGQRTDDNRIAFGGQGNPPYLFGSKIDSEIEGNEPSHEVVWKALIDLLPQLKDVAITHRWGGTLAIPRNWLPGLRYEKANGFGILGGYVGEGVAAANLAGRTMADLVLESETDIVSLPWVGVKARRWEPEPLRWIGVRASRRLMGSTDLSETRTDKTGKLAMKVAHLLRGD